MICLGSLTAAADRFISILALFLICTNEMTASVCRCALCVHVHCLWWYICTNRSRYCLLCFFLHYFVVFIRCACSLLLLLLVSFNNENWTFLLSETMSKIANKSNTINWNIIKEKVIQLVRYSLIERWETLNSQAQINCKRNGKNRDYTVYVFTWTE